MEESKRVFQVKGSNSESLGKRYLTRVKRTSEDQYAVFRSVVSETIHRQGWKVEQIRFITVTRSVNKQDLSKNLKFSRIPEAIIQWIYSIYSN